MSELFHADFVLQIGRWQKKKKKIWCVLYTYAQRAKDKLCSHLISRPVNNRFSCYSWENFCTVRTVWMDANFLITGVCHFVIHVCCIVTMHHHTASGISPLMVRSQIIITTFYFSRITLHGLHCTLYSVEQGQSVLQMRRKAMKPSFVTGSTEKIHKIIRILCMS